MFDDGDSMKVWSGVVRSAPSIDLFAKLSDCCVNFKPRVPEAGVKLLANAVVGKTKLLHRDRGTVPRPVSAPGAAPGGRQALSP